MVYKVRKKIAYLSIMSRYYLFKRKTKPKIKKIMQYNKNPTETNTNGHEESSLPGSAKYKKRGYYKYMLGRYLFAIPYIKQKRVLDSGCGLGWGSYLISDFPKSMLSIDIDSQSLNFAKKTWQSPKLNYKKHSILEMTKLEQKFDVILSFEIIEHLNQRDGQKYINQISNCLENNGFLLMSSTFPEKQEHAQRMLKTQGNEFHLHIYTKNEIKQLLEKNNLSLTKTIGNLLLIARKTRN